MCQSDTCRSTTGSQWQQGWDPGSCPGWTPRPPPEGSGMTPPSSTPGPTAGQCPPRSRPSYFTDEETESKRTVHACSWDTTRQLDDKVYLPAQVLTLWTDNEGTQAWCKKNKDSGAGSNSHVLLCYFPVLGKAASPHWSRCTGCELASGSPSNSPAPESQALGSPTLKCSRQMHILGWPHDCGGAAASPPGRGHECLQGSCAGILSTASRHKSSSVSTGERPVSRLSRTLQVLRVLRKLYLQKAPGSGCYCWGKPILALDCLFARYQLTLGNQLSLCKDY